MLTILNTTLVQETKISIVALARVVKFGTMSLTGGGKSARQHYGIEWVDCQYWFKCRRSASSFGMWPVNEKAMMGRRTLFEAPDVRCFVSPDSRDVRSTVILWQRQKIKVELQLRVLDHNLE